MTSVALATTSVIRVGAQNDCDTHSLASAIGSASNADGDSTVILLANDQNYTGLNLSVLNRNVTLQGGYAHCSSTAPVPNATTTISGAQNGGSVLTIAASGSKRLVNLRFLVLTSGSGGLGGYGGGLRISGNVEVYLNYTAVNANTATYGGGIAVIGGSGNRPRLDLFPGSRVGAAGGHNAATNGAGLFCSNADVVVSGTTLAYNDADSDGGGAYLDNCTLKSGGVSAASAISRNTAYRGGGVFATGGSLMQLGLVGGAGIVNLNQATDGGGLYLSGASTETDLYAVQVAANQALQAGGGAYVTGAATLLIDRGENDALCPPTHCSGLLGNDARTGYAAYVSTGGDLKLRHSEIIGSLPVNTSGIGANLVATGAGSSILLSDVLMRSLPAATGVLLNNQASASVANLTVAGNALDQDFMLASADTSLTIQHSIVWDAPATAVEGDGSLTNIDNNSQDTSTLPGLNADPGFINAASYDYHLRSDSPDIDAYTPVLYSVDYDVDGNPRPIDLYPDNGGIFDRGAYELGDEIFADGFDGE